MNKVAPHMDLCPVLEVGKEPRRVAHYFKTRVQTILEEKLDECIKAGEIIDRLF